VIPLFRRELPARLLFGQLDNPDWTDPILGRLIEVTRLFIAAQQLSRSSITAAPAKET
jgi:hypothetical protein